MNPASKQQLKWLLPRLQHVPDHRPAEFYQDVWARYNATDGPSEEEVARMLAGEFAQLELIKANVFGTKRGRSMLVGTKFEKAAKRKFFLVGKTVCVHPRTGGKAPTKAREVKGPPPPK